LPRNFKTKGVKLMAGQVSSDAVMWVAGEASGKDETGATVTISTALADSLLSAVTFAAGVPSGAPADNTGPLYINSANHKLYAWDGSVWVPASGFNT
jgi:fructose 1,6-bisphosphatase